jgi:hypothetical protein
LHQPPTKAAVRSTQRHRGEHAVPPAGQQQQASSRFFLSFGFRQNATAHCDDSIGGKYIILRGVHRGRLCPRQPLRVPARQFVRQNALVYVGGNYPVRYYANLR